MTLSTAAIIAKARSFAGVRAGVARLADVLDAPSCRVVAGTPLGMLFQEQNPIRWFGESASILVLGLHHPETDPGLDNWDGGNTRGNRRLMDISHELKQWLWQEHGCRALPLAYHAERGGVFLKDAAFLAGLWVVGRGNLVVTPGWGPRVRFRSILVDAPLEPARPMEGFRPCADCGETCQEACPRQAFPNGSYFRPQCIDQIQAAEAHKVPAGGEGEEGAPGLVVKYCRACEFACPVGA